MALLRSALACVWSVLAVTGLNAAEKIVFGMSAPLSGVLAPYGTALGKGLKPGAVQVNATAGIAGRETRRNGRVASGPAPALGLSAGGLGAPAGRGDGASYAGLQGFVHAHELAAAIKACTGQLNRNCVVNVLTADGRFRR